MLCTDLINWHVLIGLVSISKQKHMASGSWLASGTQIKHFPCCFTLGSSKVKERYGYRKLYDTFACGFLGMFCLQCLNSMEETCQRLALGPYAIILWCLLCCHPPHRLPTADMGLWPSVQSCRGAEKQRGRVA